MAASSGRLNDALAGRYQIERLLGSGGMADVYLAQDLKHPRRVAIKVLKPELAALLGRERFLREIELAARLQHPYILGLLDSGAAGDDLYYVMPHLEGDTLRKRLEREKQLPLEDALRITGELSEALDYANGQGVIHRDIKPENILFDGGHALLADFGIARAFGLAGGTKLTETGVTLGTSAYMSPEQVLGGAEVDGRSDQYSLACVTYEMLAGQPPFTGATAESIVHQHVAALPRPVSDVRAMVPAGVASALSRALAKAPADRFASVGEFARTLQSGSAEPGSETTGTRAMARTRRRRLALAGAASIVAVAALSAWWWNEFRGRPAAADPAEKDLIVVAQFDGPADDPGLAPAIRSMIATAVDQSRIAASVPDADLREGLRAAGFADTTRIDVTVARELAYRRSIRGVLEGEVRRVGSGFSVTTRLVDVESNNRVVISAGETAPDLPRLIPSVQRLAGRLRSSLGEQRASIRASRPLMEVATPDLGAYRLFVAWGEAARRRDFPEAARFLRGAIARDPEFGAAWFQLGVAFANQGKRDSSRWAYDQARRHWARLGDFERRYIEFNREFVQRRDLAASVLVLEQALQSNNSPAQQAAFHTARGQVMEAAGRFEDAHESFLRVSKLQTFGTSETVMSNLFLSLLRLGRFDEAQTVATGLSEHDVAMARLAVARENWALAESIGTAVARDPTRSLRIRIEGAMTAASGGMARGRATLGTGIMEAVRLKAAGAADKHAARLCGDFAASLGLFSGSNQPLPVFTPATDTSLLGTLSHVFQANAAGRGREAGIGLRRLLADPRSEWPENSARIALLSGWTALNDGREGESRNELRRVAFPDGPTFDVEEYRSRQHALWLLAGVLERAGQPDSAAICLQAMLAPYGRFRDRAAIRGFFFSFAHQRLVLLYARMGQIEPARQHWEALRAAFDEPDPELRPLVDEARTALASAEAMSKSLKR